MRWFGGLLVWHRSVSELINSHIYNALEDVNIKYNVVLPHVKRSSSQFCRLVWGGGGGGAEKTEKVPQVDIWQNPPYKKIQSSFGEDTVVVRQSKSILAHVQTEQTGSW